MGDLRRATPIRPSHLNGLSASLPWWRSHTNVPVFCLARFASDSATSAIFRFRDSRSCARSPDPFGITPGCILFRERAAPFIAPFTPTPMMLGGWRGMALAWAERN